MGYLLLAFLSMSSFGAYYFFVKILSIHIASPVIALISNAVALLVIYSYLYFTKVPILPKRKIYIVYSLIISVPVSIGLITLYLAIARGPVSIVMPIIGINSMVAVLLGISILRERVTVRKGLGILLAVAAIVLLNL
jgi:transporter family protein